MQHFKSQKSALAELCWAISHSLPCLSGTALAICSSQCWGYPLFVTAMLFLILQGPDQHLATPQSFRLTNVILNTPSYCRVPPSWGPQAPSSDVPSFWDLHCCWALLVPVPRVAMCSALWGPSFWSLDTFFPRAVVKLFPDPPLSEPQSHPNLLGLSYWDVSQNSRSQLRERICLLIPWKLNLCLKPHMVQ